MTAAEQLVLDQVTAKPSTFGELKLALPELDTRKVFDATEQLVERGTIVRVKRVEAGAVFALPGVAVANRKPDAPAPPAPRIAPRDHVAEPAPSAVRKLAPPPRAVPPPKPAEVADALGPLPQLAEREPLQQEQPTMAKDNDWIDPEVAAKLLGVGRARVLQLADWLDCSPHPDGGRSRLFSRGSVLKLKAERAAGDDTPPRKRAARAAKVAISDDLARTVRWLVDGWRLGKLTAVEALDQLADAVGAE